MNSPSSSANRFYARSSFRGQRFRRRPAFASLLGVAVVLVIAARLVVDRNPVEAIPPAGIPIVVERVIDGDTLLLASGHRVRLLGINTPESKRPDRPPESFSEEAAAFTRSLVEGRSVTLEYDRERMDDYRRILAYVFIDGALLNARIIEAGFSRAETRFPYRADRKKQFQDAEKVARANNRGIWSDTHVDPRRPKTKTPDDATSASGNNP